MIDKVSEHRCASVRCEDRDGAIFTAWVDIVVGVGGLPIGDGCWKETPCAVRTGKREGENA